ncbi:3-hydroxyisobutyryl-CoA hydrolase 1-like [Senna tora]|uniref:3-hydroxyisobutyryl-CoA hydrolase n=1 Tax=Senna tora TaxID=362788 RepID=A0A834T063_9FABA|nr:3-hydroxyisobutyryl-CoA hydrolase 1-like [Senna tora]
MALSLTFTRETDQVLFAGNSYVKEVILNRPQKLNCLNYEMIRQITRNLTSFENDSSVKLVILKANGKAFCAGGDVKSVVASALIAVMGGGAGLSMNTIFRVVTEKTVFAMPEASIGLYPDVGASYFLSRLPGYFGLTGAQLNGAEMVACGLATHFVPSKENGKERGAKKWIADALNYMHSSSPTSLKIFLRSVREGREQNIEQCLCREYDVTTHLISLESDFFEGARAKLFDKDNNPVWKPSKLELVSKEMVDQFFKEIDDEDCEPLQLPHRSKIQSKL